MNGSPNFGWSYPPGVTGREFAIAGPDFEGEVERYCPTCEKVTPFEAASYRDQAWGTCEVCLTEDEWSVEDEAPEPDYEAEMERRYDREVDEREWGGVDF